MKKIFLFLFLSQLIFINHSKAINNFNVILITLDTVRADHLSCYGYKKIKTSTIDKLAQEGILFENAITSVPITLPSHASILTGLYPFRLGVRNNGFYRVPDNIISLQLLLKNNGYTTAAFISSFILSSIYNLNQNFDLYDERMNKQKKITGEFVERDAKAVSDAALSWLKINNKLPYFLWIHYFDAHFPYEPPQSFAKLYKNNLYDGEIAYIDYQLGRIIRYVEEAAKKNQKFLIVLVSDHGEGLWQHGEPEHGIFLYQETIRVPLIISFYPKIYNKKIIKSLVRTIDIMPTILDYLSLDIPKNIDGISLLPLMKGKISTFNLEAYSETLSPKEDFGWTPLYSLQSNEWKLILSAFPEFYNITKDPSEKNNLYNKSNKTFQEKLKNNLTKLISESDLAKIEKAPVSDEDLEKLISLGYLGIPTNKTESLITPPKQKKLIKLMYKAANLFLAHKYTEAINLIQEILRINPYNREALLWLAQSYLGIGDFEEALKYAKKNLEMGDPNGVLNFNLGNIYYQLGKLKEAEFYYKKANEINPFFPNPLLNLAYLELKKGNIEKSKDYVLQVLKITKKNATAYYILGSLEALNDNMEEALKYYKIAVEIDPNYYEAWKNMGKIFYAQKNYQSAVEAFLKAINPGAEDSEVFLNLGNIYFYELKENEKALYYYKKVLEISPNHPDAYMIKQIISLLNK